LSHILGSKIISLVICFSLASIIFAQPYSIKNVLPYLSEDSIVVDLSMEDVFQGEIRRTLLAGIPVLVKFSFQLQEKGEMVVLTKSNDGRIIYDVWEESFRLFGIGIQEKNFKELSELQSWFGNLQGLNLAAIKNLSRDKEYRVLVESQIVLLTGKQSQEIKSWLQKSDQTEENLASEERSTGFRLNLNKLIQLFFSGEEKATEYHQIARSGMFTINDLQFP
jgi:hypothetical protein